MRKSLIVSVLLVLTSVASAAPTVRAGAVWFPPTSAAQIATGERGIWVKSADGLPYFRKSDGTDVGMTGGGGGSTVGVKGAYQGGASTADNIIPLTSTLGAVIVRDNVTPLGTTLFGVQSSTGGSKYFDVTDSAVSFQGTLTGNTYSTVAASGTSMSWTSTIANGATPAYVWNSTNAFTGSNKVYQFKSGGTEIASIDAQSQIYVPAGGALVDSNDGTTHVTLTNGNVALVAGGGQWNVTSTKLYFNGTDNTAFIGDTSNRAAKVWTTTVDSGSSALNLNSASLVVNIQAAGSTKIALANSGGSWQPGIDRGVDHGSASFRWGDGYYGHDSIGTAQTVGLTLSNGTAATVSQQQHSPAIALLDKTWETTGGTSQTSGYYIQAQGVKTTTVTSDLAIYSNNNGAITEAFRFKFNNTGTQGSFSAGAGATNTVLFSPNGNQQIILSNSQVDILQGGTDVIVSSLDFHPSGDNSYTNGDLTHRWKGVFNSANLSCGENTQSGTTFTATVTDCVISMTNSAARTVTLPAASAVPVGHTYFIWDGNGNAGTNNVSVAPNGTDNIDGANATKAVVTANFAHSTCQTVSSTAWLCGVNN